jgi:hypothetical protein
MKYHHEEHEVHEVFLQVLHVLHGKNCGDFHINKVGYYADSSGAAPKIETGPAGCWAA